MKRGNSIRLDAFTIAELIVVLAAAAALAGVIVPAVRPQPANERRIVCNEAHSLCLWIKNHISRAAREGTDIKFILTDDADKNYMVRVHRVHGAVKSESFSFAADGTKLAYEGARELYFSARWFTLTPAATFIVKSKHKAGIRFFVTVSGAGYASVKEKL